jgi:protein-S-isoprenylcysteine O-methyltransferase Ste14
VDEVVRALGWVGAVAAIGTVAVALGRTLAAVRRPALAAEPAARVTLSPPVLLAVTVVLTVALTLIWRPLPVHPSPGLRLVMAAGGLALLLSSLGLYAWGMGTLGAGFSASSGLAARLPSGHHLVTGGPFAVVRHPMYVALWGASLGAVALYLTWTTVAVAAMNLSLIVRARREERLLDQVYGDAWRAYAARVPPWMPRRRPRR